MVNSDLVQMRALLSNELEAGIKGARPSITLENLLRSMALKSSVD